MANDINACHFTCRLGKDPETRYTPSGTAIASVSAAVGSKYKDEDKTVWIKLIAFGKAAEILSEYAHKGQQLATQCRYELSEWETNEGVKRSTPQFVIEKFTLIGSKPTTEQRRPEPQGPLEDQEVPF
jgi:single-strand DNA-binding protein